jgi:hypothetical protein
LAVLLEVSAAFPFPIKEIDSDSEFLNAHLLRYCEEQTITFARSRPGHKNDGAHVEQKNWSVVRQAVDYHRHDTAAELQLLNEISALLPLWVNFFSPQQKPVTKTRIGAKVTRATTPLPSPTSGCSPIPGSPRRSRPS